MANIGYATLTIIPSARGFGSALAGQTTPAMVAAGSKGGAKMGAAAKTSFLAPFKGVAGPLAAIFAGKAVLGGIGSAITAASDLGEAANATNVVFGESADAIRAVGETAATDFGLSEVDFLGKAVEFSAFVDTIAGESGSAADTVSTLVGRAADLASVLNIPLEEATTLIRSGLAGESEPFRRYGVDVSAATVATYAYNEGIAEQGAKLTEAQKVQARHLAIMDQTQKVQGDFANTSDSLANRQRILAARFGDLKSVLGQGLVPVAEKVLGVVGTLFDKFGPLATQLAGPLAVGFAAVSDAVGSLAGGGASGPLGAVVTFATALLPVLKGIGDDVLAVVVPGFQSIVAVVQDQFLPAVERILPIIQPVAAFLLQTIGGAVVGVLKGAMTFVKGAFEFISGLFNTFASLVTGDWDGLWEGIKQTFSGVVNLIKGAIQVWWNLGILKVFRTSLAALKGLWSKGLGAIKTSATTVLEFIKGLVGRILGGITGLFKTGASTVVNVVKTGFSSLLNLYKTGLTGAFNLVKSILGKVLGVYKTVFSKVFGVVKELPGKVVSALGDLGSTLLNSGKDLVRGFISGIKSMAGALISAIRNTITDKLPGFVKDALGIQSPSKVFATLGAQVAEGFVVGIESGVGSAEKAMRRLVTPPPSPSLSTSVSDAPTGFRPTGVGVAASYEGLIAEMAAVRTEIRRQTDRSAQLTRTGAR